MEDVQMEVISSCNLHKNHRYNLIKKVTYDVINILQDAKIIISDNFPLEISHHYGIDCFFKYGCVTISIINRAYCKKIIILFPQQEHPAHIHKIKDETFHILQGDMFLTADKKSYSLNAGDLYTIESGVLHSFGSKNGCIFEEISTTHSANDSYYEDEVIARKEIAQRKTFVKYWKS